MKRILIIALWLSSILTIGQNDFSKLTVTSDSTYGYTFNRPLNTFKDSHEKTLKYTNDFLRALKTQDDQGLEILIVYTLGPSKKRFNKEGAIDLYYFLTSVKKDTVKIYVDVYNKGQMFVPKGLKIKS